MIRKNKRKISHGRDASSLNPVQFSWLKLLMRTISSQLHQHAFVVPTERCPAANESLFPGGSVRFICLADTSKSLLSI